MVVTRGKVQGGDEEGKGGQVHGDGRRLDLVGEHPTACTNILEYSCTPEIHM